MIYAIWFVLFAIGSFILIRNRVAETRRRLDAGTSEVIAQHDFAESMVLGHAVIGVATGLMVWFPISIVIFLGAFAVALACQLVYNYAWFKITAGRK